MERTVVLTPLISVTKVLVIVVCALTDGVRAFASVGVGAFVGV